MHRGLTDGLLLVLHLLLVVAECRQELQELLPGASTRPLCSSLN